MNEKEKQKGHAVSISLAVVTYNRSDLIFDKFLNALHSVVSANLKPSEIIVVNNDDKEFETALKTKISSARGYWLKHADKDSIDNTDWPDIIVRTSPEKNLAVARNHALDTAKGAFVVFMDDDQQVATTWLAELVACLERYNADVVAGPVYCEYPESAPLWLQNTDIHNTRGNATGDKLYRITAGNTLIQLSSIGGVRFDARFGQTGGEDTDFFKRLYESGRDIRWCEEAVSTEWITADRANTKYAIRRFIDQGHTYRRMFLVDAGLGRAALFFARSVLQAAVAGGIAIVFVALRKPSAGDWVKRCFNNLGKLSHRESHDYS